jgi:hypothetical protein
MQPSFWPEPHTNIMERKRDHQLAEMVVRPETEKASLIDRGITCMFDWEIVLFYGLWGCSRSFFEQNPTPKCGSDAYRTTCRIIPEKNRISV